MKAYAVKTAILAVLTAFGMNLENIVVFVEADTVEKVDKRADIIAAVFRTPDDGGRESGADLGVRGGETVSASVRFAERCAAFFPVAENEQTAAGIVTNKSHVMPARFRFSNRASNSGSCSR